MEVKDKIRLATIGGECFLSAAKVQILQPRAVVPRNLLGA